MRAYSRGMRGIIGEAIILAGERGRGKTSACREVARLAAAAGLSVGGLISPSRRDAEGRPLEIELESLASGERRLLASRVMKLDGPSWPPAEGTVPRLEGTVPPAAFSFSGSAFAWALALLRAQSASDLLIVDEVGPLELEAGSGFLPFLLELARGQSLGAPGLILATVRPSLAEKLALILAPAGTVPEGPQGGTVPAFSTLRLDESTRERLPRAIAARAIALRGGKKLHRA